MCCATVPLAGGMRVNKAGRLVSGWMERVRAGKTAMGWGSGWPRGSRCVGGRSPSRSQGRVGCVRRTLDVRAGVVSLRGQQEGGNSSGRGLVLRMLVT